ncbi:MAG: PEGA domain-containing protein [Spirochaetales bacterium]|nr:PEGA domain-containing protein [Spirochaetales bacterium]
MKRALLLLSLFFCGCSTLQKIQTTAEEFLLPVLRVQHLPVAAREDSEDFKIRTSRSGPLVLIHQLQTKEGQNVETATLSRTLLLSRMSFPDVKWVEAPRNLLPVTEAENRKFLRDNRADALADFSLEGAGTALTLTLRLLDPYSGTPFSELRQDIKVHERPLPSGHQDIIRYGDQILFLTNTTGAQLELQSPRPAAALREFLLTSITGRLNVSSSAAATQVVLTAEKGSARKLGSTPLENVLIEEGRYTLQFQRTGFKSITQTIQVRAGRTENIVVPWPDDPVQHMAVLYSSPTDLRIAVDGQVRGNTPLYLNGLEKGDLPLELSRLKENAYEVVGEAVFKVSEPFSGRAFLLKHEETFPAELLSGDLFRPVAERGTVKFQGPGLSLTTSQPDRWGGIATIPFFIDSFDARLAVVESEGGRLLWLIESSGDSVAVEVNGNTYRAIHLRDKKTLAMSPIFQTRLPSPEGRHTVRIQYLKEKKEVKVKVDGTAIYEAEFLPATEASLSLLTRGEGADGRKLADHLSFASGRGRLDGRLVDWPFLDDVVDFVKRR